MPTTRIVTDVPENQVAFVLAIIQFDGGTAVEQTQEDDGEYTIVASFPGDDAQIPAAATGSLPARWLEIAKTELGVSEAKGNVDNPRIIMYHASTHGGGSPDSVPWCSSFVNFCVEGAGVNGTDSKSARSWLQWGREVAQLEIGCIVVLQRGSPPNGHVGFFVGAENGRVRLLGGNQSDRVSIASFDGADVIGMRMPP